jgi:hypothetical protein
MHRARLADKAGAELLEHPVGTDENLEEAPHGIGVIGRMLRIPRKADGIGQFVRHFMDGDVNADVGERRQDLRIKARDGMSRQRELARGAAAPRNAQEVVDEIEFDLEVPRPSGMGEVASPRAVT